MISCGALSCRINAAFREPGNVAFVHQRRTLSGANATNSSMTRRGSSNARVCSAMVLGVGAFAYSTAQILKEAGAEVATYLTRNYGHHPPSLAGSTYSHDRFPSPIPLIQERGVDLVVPMSIDWAQAPWKDELLASGAAIFCPIGEAIRIERERDFARQPSPDFKIPFPRAQGPR